MTRKSLLIISLVALATFLVLPKTCLADNFENITPLEVGEYLELPGEDAEKILDTLHQVFVDEGIDLITSTATDEQIAVIAILNNISKIHILNHLLVDAPIEITGKIIKTAIDIARLFGAKDISVAMDKFEKETVKMAIDYATKKLFQDEIKVSPGAIQFKYKTYQGEQKEITLQYIIIYQQLDNKKAKTEIRFYSPNSIKVPEFRGSTGFSFGSLSDLNHDISPFIVEIQGTVERGKLDNYNWAEGPSIEITFSDSVPDFGIKPLSFWQRHLLKPIETAIGNIDVMITKATGKSLNLVTIWDKIKSTFFEFSSISPAAIGENRTVKAEEISTEQMIEQAKQEIRQEIEQMILQEMGDNSELILNAIQQGFDNFSTKFETMNEKVTSLDEEKEIENINEVKEEIKEEKDEENKGGVQPEPVICIVNSGDSPDKNKVIINEIAWMGTTNSAADEWIELRNISGTAVNLAGWQLLDKDNQIEIIFTKENQIPANGFYLLERTDDNSVPNVAADLIYTGGLGNTNEAIYLFDENCQLQDEVLTNSDWSDGDNSSKRTMERKNNLTWQTSSNIGGTPKKANSNGYYVYSGGGYTPDPEPDPEPGPVCDSENLNLCITQELCEGISLYWYSETCNLNAEPEPDPESDPELVCDSENLDLCTNQIDCEAVMGYWYNQSCNSEPKPKILITEIQAGDAQTTHDFIRLFNPTQEDIYLGDYTSGHFKLVKRTQSGTENISIKSWLGDSEAKIPAQEEYLWACSKDGDFPSSVSAEAQTTQTISLNNGVGILFIKNDESIILDAVGWGDFNNVLFEGTAFPQNPAENQNLIRKLDTDNNYIDTYDNSQDFELQTLSSKFLTEISGTINLSVLPKINSPYLIESTAVIPENSTLTIEPGVVIKFGSPNGRLLVQGTLKAVGTEDEKIVFTSNSNNLQPGNWRQIYFSSTSADSQLNNVVVKYAGYPCPPESGAVVVKNTSITIKNSVFENNKDRAVYLIDPLSATIIDNVKFSNTISESIYGSALSIQGGSPAVKNCIFENNVYGVYITNNVSSEIKNNIFRENKKPIYVSNSYPIFQDNQMLGDTNDINGIFVYADDIINQDTVWQSNLPYIVDGGLWVAPNYTFTLAPGTIIKFYDSTSGFWIKGTLKAIGTENEKIIFTSYNKNPQPGDWGQIYFTNESINSELENVIIEYGGNKSCFWDRTTVMVRESFVSFKNSVFQNNKNKGLYLSQSSSVIDNVQFLNHQTAYNNGSAIAFLVNGNDTNNNGPTLKNSTFRNNTKDVEAWDNALIIQENNQYY